MAAKPRPRASRSRTTRLRRPARTSKRPAARKLPAAALVGASGLAPGMAAVNTYLAVANVGASMAFLERAFGFTRGVVLPGPDGQVRYAEMRHGESAIMLVPRGDSNTASQGVAGLYTYVADVDRAAAQAREAGAGVGEPEDKPWGDRVAAVVDPDGYRWILATFKKLAPFQMEHERRKGVDRRRPS